MSELRCPQCKGPVPERIKGVWPFCSKRCKLLDLGMWANEEYRIPAVEAPDAQELEQQLQLEDEDS